MLRYYILILFSTPLFMFAQTENFWVKKSDFGGLKRERAVAFSIGNFGYIAAGVDTAENTLKDLWQYDPIFDTWSQKANIPGSVRRDAIAFAVGNKGYVGTGMDNDESFAGLKLKDFWEYDPATNLWTQKADFPGGGGMGVYFATAFAVDSKGYVCCGKIGPNTYTNELWEYKPSINQWTQRANFPGGVRYQLSSFTIGYYGYVGLGANQDVFKKDFWRYNAGTNQWSPIADLPASERGGACTFTLGTRGFVCMGNDGGILDDLWEYNPATNDWASRASYGGSERKNAVAFTVYGKAFVGTGKGYSGKKAGMEEYNPYFNVGLNEEKLMHLSVYPNPTTEYLKVSTQNKVSDLSLFSTDGRLIKSISAENTSLVEVEMQDLNSGVYILKASDKEGRIVASEQIIRL